MQVTCCTLLKPFSPKDVGLDGFIFGQPTCSFFLAEQPEFSKESQFALRFGSEGNRQSQLFFLKRVCSRAFGCFP